MKTEEKSGFEPWARAVFVLGGLVAGTFLYLGWRPGGRGPILAFSLGLPLLGTGAALGMAVGLVWSVLHRPFLQRGRLKALLCAGACVWACSWPIPYPSSHEDRPSTVSFRLPFAEERRVRWGGDGRIDNAMLLDPARRFGLVFEPPEASVTEDRTVLAPASGIVRGVSQLGAGAVQAVVLEVAEGEFLFLEGLVPDDSLLPGESIAAGAPLGSQAESSPLTVYLSDRLEPGAGEGIPFTFRSYEVGGNPVARGFPVRGERVAPDPAVSDD